jgi:pyruvate dehydrogenase E2 component (dihydrolipoamide acetyltransferase)
LSDSNTSSLSRESADLFEPPFDSAKLSTMRRVVGRRMQESKREAPHFYLSVEVDIDALEMIRKRETNALSVNDCVLKAAALALRVAPALNGRIVGEEVRTFKGVNLAFAVAVPEGLVTPVLRDADRLSLSEIAAQARSLVARARGRKLSPDDCRGGTFTVSNLGMLGVDAFAAIVNPPQSGILALGRAAQRPVVRAGSLAVAKTMVATLSADHRAIDGAAGAAYLCEFRRLLETPDELWGMV